jgi:DNA-binding NarL/FixJ family response regulator
VGADDGVVPDQVSTFLQKSRPIVQADGPALAASWSHERCALDAAAAMFICQPTHRATDRLAVQRKKEPRMSLRVHVVEVRPSFGWDSLSESECRVADLVARGFSNKEIAERLYMSHRTVGSHLYRIFPKLGLRSRVELARLVIERSILRPQ